MQSFVHAVFVLATMILNVFSVVSVRIVRFVLATFADEPGSREEASDAAETLVATVSADDISDRIKRSTSDVERQKQKHIDHLRWRREYGVDSILETPKPYFDVVKKYYPHVFHKRSKGKAACVIQMEKAGQFGTLLEAVGRYADEIGRPHDDPAKVVIEHVSFVMTFLFEKLDARPWPNGKTIRIVDMSNLGMNDIGMEVFAFLGMMSDASKVGFVERIHKIYVVNPPQSFAVIYGACKSMISEKTRRQIIVCADIPEFVKQVSREVSLDDIPREYGGSCDCVDCWRGDENEEALCRLVGDVNRVSF